MNIGHILFKLEYDYYLSISFKDKIDLYSNSHLANKLAKKLKDLM